MKTLQEILPTLSDDNVTSTSYESLVEAIREILLKTDEGSYQGDSWVIVYDEGKLGYLQFGWGSCSGCDAIQGCNTVKDLESFLTQLRDQTRWFDNLSSFISFFKTHDWEGDYRADGRNIFLKEVDTLIGIMEAGLTKAPLYLKDEKFGKTAEKILEGKLNFAT